MREEVVHVDSKNGKKAEDDLPVSMNTQMMIGVAVVGFMAFRINRNLKLLLINQKQLAEGMMLLGEGVSEQTTAAKDLIGLVAGKAVKEAS